MSTSFIKSSDIDRKWILINAEGMVLGRMAVIIANILRGKTRLVFPQMLIVVITLSL